MPLTGAAAARLYDDHVDAVHFLVARRVGPDASPVVVAETFERAIRSWDRFDQDRGTERLFLFSAAIAALKDHDAAERNHLRSLAVRRTTSSTRPMVDPLVSGEPQRLPRVVDRGAGHGPLDESTAPADVGSDLMAAIADLTPGDRDIVLLSLWESCSQAAIAETLDLTVGAVRSALGRIRRELKIATTTTKGRRR